MRFVASKYKVALDGTPDTLSLVDQYIREARLAYAQRPESIDLVAPAVGAYLGAWRDWQNTIGSRKGAQARAILLAQDRCRVVTRTPYDEGDSG